MFITRDHSTIGSLNYLVTCTMPELAIIVSILLQFYSKPDDYHWSAVKKQATVALSTEAEYMSLTAATKESYLVDEDAQ